MQVLAFDTHAFVKRLTDAGMPGKQAEVLASEQVSLIEGNLATKQHVAEIMQRMKESEEATARRMKELESATAQRIKESEEATARHIAEQKADIIKWVSAALLGQAAILAAALTTLI